MSGSRCSSNAHWPSWRAAGGAILVCAIGRYLRGIVDVRAAPTAGGTGLGAQTARPSVGDVGRGQSLRGQQHIDMAGPAAAQQHRHMAGDPVAITRRGCQTNG
ncbi:hypothetical protein CTKZ_21850 [Cellulomonas algicola]|uniref:Uncharacterized protein n=1 Tax=Cellulomonas algicola TaxID=2071633 RepID=A0A401V148_9CELL|nr:hypothetical protein CTKZ_21850 [Cellulomonas algicola]